MCLCVCCECALLARVKAVYSVVCTCVRVCLFLRDASDGNDNARRAVFLLLWTSYKYTHTILPPHRQPIFGCMWFCIGKNRVWLNFTSWLLPKLVHSFYYLDTMTGRVDNIHCRFQVHRKFLLTNGLKWNKKKCELNQMYFSHREIVAKRYQTPLLYCCGMLGWLNTKAYRCRLPPV